jgi:hypothetical protein
LRQRFIQSILTPTLKEFHSAAFSPGMGTEAKLAAQDWFKKLAKEPGELQACLEFTAVHVSRRFATRLRCSLYILFCRSEMPWPVRYRSKFAVRH